MSEPQQPPIDQSDSTSESIDSFLDLEFGCILGEVGVTKVITGLFMICACA
jgi:hypothetical protein